MKDLSQKQQLTIIAFGARPDPFAMPSQTGKEGLLFHPFFLTKSIMSGERVISYIIPKVKALSELALPSNSLPLLTHSLTRKVKEGEIEPASLEGKNT